MVASPVLAHASWYNPASPSLVGSPALKVASTCADVNPYEVGMYAAPIGAGTAPRPSASAIAENAGGSTAIAASNCSELVLASNTMKAYEPLAANGVPGPKKPPKFPIG